MRAVVGQLRPVEIDRRGAVVANRAAAARQGSQLPLSARQMVARRRPVRRAAREAKPVRGESDQLVEAAGRKFPTSVANSDT
jgi:hypothetical protein